MSTEIIVLICVAIFVLAIALLIIGATLVYTPTGHLSIISDRKDGPWRTIGSVYNFKKIFPFEFVSATVNMTQYTNNIPPLKVQALKSAASKIIVYLLTKEMSLAWQISFKGIEHKQTIMDMLNNKFDLRAIINDIAPDGSPLRAYQNTAPIADADLQNFLADHGLILPNANFNLSAFEALVKNISKKKLENYFQISQDGKLDEQKIFEMLKDIVQSAFREQVANCALLDIISTQHEIIKKVKDKLMFECERRGLPIKIIDLTMQDTMEILNKDLEQAMESQAIIETKKEAAEHQKELDIFEAEKKKELDLIEAHKNIELAKLDAEQQKITLNALKKNYGIDQLKDEKIAEHFLERRAADVFEQMAKSPNKVFFFNNGDSVLAQIMATIQSISNTGGKNS